MLSLLVNATALAYDVLIYGSTPAGFAAALAARDAGAERVLLVEPTAHVGGMAGPGGIGLRDCEKNAVRENNASQHRWGWRNAAHYGVSRPVWQPDMWLAEQTFREMLSEARVELRVRSPMIEGTAGVRVANKRIRAIALEPQGHWVEAKIFIDASYEGELLMAAGAQFTYGREARSTYDESLAGVTQGSIAKFTVPVSATRTDGSLLNWIQAAPDPRTRVGAADDNLMAYSFRACLTANRSNMVPITAPPGYDPADFELPRRLLLAELAAGKSVSAPWELLPYHGYEQLRRDMKYDACCGKSPVGIDAVGLAAQPVNYATATRAERGRIAAAHRYYVQGLLFFWSNDASVPAGLRAKHRSLGLCKDEWPDNGHFPPQLYVREAARLVGDRVFTQHSRVRAEQPGGCRPDAIAVASWAFDIHEMERVAVAGDGAGGGGAVPFNEGLTSPRNGGSFFFELPYWLLLPQRADLLNLAAPNCPSVSHVAFSAIREEPTLWQLGQAAGAAAAIAAAAAPVPLALQDVPLAGLQAELLRQDAFIHWPPRPNCSVPVSNAQ